MVEYLARSVWTSTPTPAGLAVLHNPIRGVACHWTGGTGYGPHSTLAQSCSRLEGFRRFHTDPPPAGRGWSDFAYTVAIDTEGRVFQGRGVTFRSAANGNQTVNSSHGAVLFLLGQGDTPTVAMLDAFRAWHRDRWLYAWPAATEVVGHRDLSRTDCPGPAAYEIVRSGKLSLPPEEDDVSLSAKDLAAIADELLSSRPGAAGARYKATDVGPDGPVQIGLTDVGTRTLALLRRLQAEQDRQAGVLATIGDTVAQIVSRMPR